MCFLFVGRGLEDFLFVGGAFEDFLFIHLKSPWTAFHGSAVLLGLSLRRPTQRSGWAWKIDVGWGWKIDVGGLGRLLKSPWTAFHGSAVLLGIYKKTHPAQWAGL
jgi:hypothetical protein